jgi:hypothetical protein
MSLTGQDLIALFKRQPVGITCGLVSLGLLAFNFSVRAGAQDEGKQLLEEKKTEASRIASNNNPARNLDKRAADLAAVNKEVRDRAVQHSNLSVNLKYFYEIEAASGVKDLNTSQLGPVAPAAKTAAKTTYQPVAYKVSVQGEFPQIVDLLRRLEMGTRYARILDLKLSPSAREGPEASKLTLILSVELLGLPTTP